MSYEIKDPWVSYSLQVILLRGEINPEIELSSNPISVLKDGSKPLIIAHSAWFCQCTIKPGSLCHF